MIKSPHIAIEHRTMAPVGNKFVLKDEFHTVWLGSIPCHALQRSATMAAGCHSATIFRNALLALNCRPQDTQRFF